jgi:hypothetical protein
MKKYLLGYQINGQTIGKDIFSWEGDLNGNKPFKIIVSGETIPNGYADISNISTWHQFGNQVANDYLVYKNAIKELVIETGWSNLTNTEKDLTIQYYAYDNPTDAVIYLMTTKGMTQQQAQGYLLLQWHKHHCGVVNTCKQRWYYVKFTVPQYLSFTYSEDLLNTIEPLIFSLNDMGRQGINYGDKKEGIMDYIESTNSFEGQGLRQSGYTLLQGTWDDFISQIKNVLVDGIYNKYSDIELN